MATIEKQVNFSGKDWGGYCRATYTALDGTINVSKIEFKAKNNTTASWGPYFDNNQSRTFTCAGTNITANIANVRIKQISYYTAPLNRSLVYTGKLNAISYFTFTCRARSSEPYMLTPNFPIPMTFSQYTISYNANGGSSTPGSQTKIYGTALTLAGSISRNSYTTNGYITYFNGSGGSVSSANKIAKDTTTYSFSNWKSSENSYYNAGSSYTLNAATTMTAQWSSSTSKGSITTATASRTADKYNWIVSFSGNGGTSPSSQNSTKTRTYTSKGWFESTSGGSPVATNGGSYTPSTNGKTLYAQWNYSDSAYSAITLPSTTRSQGTANHIISFNIMGGNSATPGNITSNATITYSFAGWYFSNGSKVSSPYTPSSNITLYAHWNNTYSNYASITLPSATKANTSISRTLTFNAMNGTCPNSSLTSTQITTYTLNGWYNAASGGSKKGTAGQTYTNPAAGTLYAYWDNHPGAFPNIKLPTATRTGYIFKGWNANKSATTGMVGNYTVNANTVNTTVYAIWQEDRPQSVTLTISDIGRTKIRFTCSCKGVVNPIYTLHYKAENQTEQTYQVDGSETSVIDKIENLQPGTTYTLYIVAENSSHTFSDRSSDIVVTTKVDIPKNLTLNISNIKYTSATVTCSATGDTNANITNYKVYWRSKPSKPIYDMPIKVLSDGSCWARIFYHHNRDGNELFSADRLEEFKNIQTTDRYSRLYLLDDDTYKNNDGYFEFMLCYPRDTIEYNRWIQKDSPCNLYTGTGAGTEVPGYARKNVDWDDGNWGGLERNSEDPDTILYTYLDGSVGFSNWWYALGAIQTYPSPKGIGIPGYSSINHRSVVISGPVELWIKIDEIGSGNIYFKDLGTATSGTIDALKDYTKYIFFFSSTNSAGTNWSSAINIETYKGNSAEIMVKNGWPHDEYQKLDYIESTGVQWIDTEINPNNYNSRLNIEADVEFTDITGAWNNGWQTIIGAAYGDFDGTWHWNPQFHLAINAHNQFEIEYPCTDVPTTTDYGYIISDILAARSRHKVSLLLQGASQSLKVDGFIKENSVAPQGGPNCNLYIFGRNYTHPTQTYPIAGSAAKMKLYHLTIVDTATQSVLRSFYPCRRKSDNKYGLYDAITDTFYTNLNNQADFNGGNVEVWNKGCLLYKKDGDWKRVKEIYVKNNSSNNWKKSKE